MLDHKISETLGRRKIVADSFIADRGRGALLGRLVGHKTGGQTVAYRVALFFTIAYAAVRVALSTEDPFVRYATFGIVVWLLGQMMINVGMVLAVLPVIGIPLPIVSYGGSALLPSLVALGLVIGFARREPEAAAALAARRRNRSAGLSASTSR